MLLVPRRPRRAQPIRALSMQPNTVSRPDLVRPLPTERRQHGRPQLTTLPLDGRKAEVLTRAGATAARDETRQRAQGAGWLLLRQQCDHVDRAGEMLLLGAEEPRCGRRSWRERFPRRTRWVTAMSATDSPRVATAPSARTALPVDAFTGHVAAVAASLRERQRGRRRAHDRDRGSERPAHARGPGLG